MVMVGAGEGRAGELYYVHLTLPVTLPVALTVEDLTVKLPVMSVLRYSGQQSAIIPQH